MPILNEDDRFVPEDRIPTLPIQTTFHAGYIAMGRFQSSGLVLMDDAQPAYFVTDDFIRYALDNEVRRLRESHGLAQSRAIEAAGLLTIGNFLHRSLLEDWFDRLLLGVPNWASVPPVQRISPQQMPNEQYYSVINERYGVYRTTSAVPSAMGWYFVRPEMGRKIHTAPKKFPCEFGHENDDFDRGTCIVAGCGRPLITSP